MLQLEAKIRKIKKKKVKSLRRNKILPAVLYGSKIKDSLLLEVDEKEFEKVYSLAGESSLVSLKVGDKNIPVLIHEIQKDRLTGKVIHIDFYNPSLEKEVEVTVPIILEGEALAVKELGGTLVKNIAELKVKSVPDKLPHEIKVDISVLKTFEDRILIKDLKLPEGVKVSHSPEEILFFVAKPEKVEEELEKPIEEKVEQVEKVKKPEKEDKKELQEE